ncbi:hypothetical protein DL93DRAFT_700847 [Clavulina sp. PMI_390]|nr:hypothetical protein DL93DRAFT_700847 [Clavulina sp. PMI_390]
MRGIALQSQIHHPNVLRIEGCFCSESMTLEPFTVVYPKFQRLEETFPFCSSIPNLRQVLLDLGASVGHLHDLGVVHGDLQWPNVVIAPGFEIRLWNFGMNRIFFEETALFAREHYRPSSRISHLTEAGDIYGCAMLFLSAALASDDAEPNTHNEYLTFVKIAERIQYHREDLLPQDVPSKLRHLSQLSTQQGEELWNLILEMTDDSPNGVKSMELVNTRLCLILEERVYNNTCSMSMKLSLLYRPRATSDRFIYVSLYNTYTRETCA